MTKNNSWPQAYHNDMIINKRHGRLIIQYEAGAVTTVRKEEVLKLKDYLSE